MSKEERGKEGSANGWGFAAFGGGVLVVAGVLIVLFLMNGKTTSVGGEEEVTTTASITCQSEGNMGEFTYPFYAGGGAQEVKINAILKNDKIDTISLTLRIYAEGEKTIEMNTTKLHGEMNKAFGASQLGADALGATYSSLEDYSQMILYSEVSELNGVTERFFLLEGANGSYAKEKIQQVYREKGLGCIFNE